MKAKTRKATKTIKKEVAKKTAKVLKADKKKPKVKIKAQAKKTAPIKKAISKKPITNAKQKLIKAEKKVETKIIESNVALKEMILNPSPKLLRPFREAAKDTKKILQLQKKKKNIAANFLAKPVKNGKKYLVDLRVHAPGTVGYFFNGGIEPGPAIARLAEVKGLHMMGLAEYYNASFLDMVMNNNPCVELRILPGVIICTEVASCKEVFFIVLFPETARAPEIYNFLNELQVPRSAYGRRDYCLTQDLGEILKIVESHGAVAIPSRVDKTPYRQLAIPELVEKYGMRSFDLAHPDSPEYFKERWPEGGFTFFTFSSANALGQIGNRVEKITLGELGFAGIKEIVTSTKDEISEAIEIERS